jgi:type VI secretion system protein ImpJ
MSDSNRVVWSEGLFLRPQHFQQAERFVEKLFGEGARQLQACAYGFSRIELDQELAKLGKVGVAAIEGMFPDATPFSVPNDADIPTPLEIPDAAKDSIISLALPLRRPGMPSMALKPNQANALVRYHAADFDARDAVADLDSGPDARNATMQIGKLNLSLRLAQDLTPAYASLAVARVVEKRPDGRLVFDEEFFPPVLDCRAAPRLYDYIKEVYGLLRHRAQALADRVAQPGSKGVAEFADFLLLQLCNRLQPVLAHLANRTPLHPESLYSQLLPLAGELATFVRKDRRSPEFEPYRHDALWDTFLPVMEEIRRGLTAILDSAAVAIPLEDMTRGYYVGRVQDVELLRNSIFVLAVNAQMPAETLRARFPRESQIGARERIQALVNAQIPGITLRPLPVAPRQIPFHAGYTYFELDKSRRPNDPVDYWKELESQRMVVLHVAGDYPELNLQLWGIRVEA